MLKSFIFSESHQQQKTEATTIENLVMPSIIANNKQEQVICTIKNSTELRFSECEQRALQEIHSKDQLVLLHSLLPVSANIAVVTLHPTVTTF